MNEAKTDTQKMWGMMKLQREVARMAEDVCASLERFYYETCVAQILSANYGSLGVVTGVRELFGGEVNRNYEASIVRDGSLSRLFVRQYERDKQASELDYEHNLFFHLRKHGFDLTPVPLPADSDETYVRCTVGEREFFFSVNEFLEGENTYQWERNNVTETACESAARALARFHAAASTYDPPENCCNREPVIREQLMYYGADILQYHRELSDICKAAGKDGASDLFPRYMDEKQPYIDQILPRLQKIFDRENELFKTVVHTDPHPGNFKYREEHVVGMFDFDWVKTDVRLYDVGIACIFFCCSWDSHNNGEADLSLLKLFVSSYNDELIRQGSRVPQLTPYEQEVFAEMMAIGSMYVVHFCLAKCCRDPNMDQYLSFYYVQHQMRCIEWADQHAAEIRAAVQNINT